MGGRDIGQQAPAAAARVEEAIPAKRREHAGVEAAALALEHRRAVPGQPQPLEVVQNRGRGSGPVAWGVEVVKTEQPLPAMAAGVEPADQGGTEVAEMQGPGGGGGKPAAVAPCSSIDTLLEQGLQVIRQAQGGADQP